MVNRNLDGCYFRVRRGEKYEDLCFTDLTRDELGKFFDEHDFSVADLLAIICARLSEFPEKVFTTELMVDGHDFDIKISSK